MKTTQTKPTTASAKDTDQLAPMVQMVRDNTATLAAIVEKQRKIDDVELQLSQLQATVRQQNISLPGSNEKDARGKLKFRIGNVVEFLRTGNRKIAEYELDIAAQTMKRNEDEYIRRALLRGDAMALQSRATNNTLADSAGGFLVPDEVATELFPAFYANTALKKAGARVINPSGVPFRINRIDTKSTAYHHAEAVAPTSSNPAFGQVDLMPRKASVFVKVTEEQIKWGTPSTDGIISDDIQMQLMVDQDKKCFEGTGSNNQPLGIKSAASLTTYAMEDTSTYVPRFYDMIKMQVALDNANALNDDGSLAYVMHPLSFGILRTERIAQYSGDTKGAYVMLPMSDAKVQELIGYPVIRTTSLTVTSSNAYAFFAHWKDVVIAEWGGVELKKSDVASDGTDNAFTQDIVFIKASVWYDVAVVRPAAVVYSSLVRAV